MTSLAAAGLLLVSYSNQGHWFGGRPATIELCCVVPAPSDVVVEWRLALGNTELVADRLLLRKGDAAGKILLTPPLVRLRSKMRFCYRAVQVDTRATRGEGEADVIVYPTGLLTGLADRLADRRLVVCDRVDELPAVLTEAQVPHRTVESLSQLQTASADILLIGVDRIDDSPFAQNAMLNLAQSGTSVVVFAQSRIGRLATFRLARRARETRWEPRSDHPLLLDFEPETLTKWCEAVNHDPLVIELPLDEPALEVVYRPREVAGRQAVGIDALIAVKQLGAGRLVLCQLPRSSWCDDPRGQLLLRNMLNYALTRPEPTPPPSQRRIARPAPQPHRPEIHVSPGGDP